MPHFLVINSNRISHERGHAVPLDLGLEWREQNLPIRGERKQTVVDNFHMRAPLVEKTLISKNAEAGLRVGSSCFAKLRNINIAQVLGNSSSKRRYWWAWNTPVIMRSPSALARTSTSRRRSALA